MEEHYDDCGEDISSILGSGDASLVTFDAKPNPIGRRLDPEMLANITEHMFNVNPVSDEQLGLTPRIGEIENAELFYRTMNQKNGRIDIAELSSTDGSNFRLAARRRLNTNGNYNIICALPKVTDRDHRWIVKYFVDNLVFLTIFHVPTAW